MPASRLPILALVSLCVLTVAARAQAPADNPEKARKDAAARGLAVLAKDWAPDRGPAAQPGGGAPVAVASLSGIAFFQAGSTQAGGPYQAPLNACLDLVLAGSGEGGLLASGNTQGPMYGHGFGMLFLAEALARAPDDASRRRIRPVLEKAVALSEKAQNKEGGWRYRPVPSDADVSVTVGQLNGLLAAKGAGVRVSPDVLKKALDYVRSCQNDDGGFSYMSGHKGNSGLPRTAAALAALEHAGAATPAQRDKALKFITKAAAAREMHWTEGHVFYGHYYAAQALDAAGGEHRAKVAAAFRDDLITRQQPDGSWTGDFDKTYATAMAVIALQIPDAWLTVLPAKKAP
jgi:hypothetical protein